MTATIRAARRGEMVEIGKVELRGGVAVGTTRKVQRFLRGARCRNPDGGPRLTPKDGDRFIAALPATYGRGPYVTVTLGP